MTLQRLLAGLQRQSDIHHDNLPSDIGHETMELNDTNHERLMYHNIPCLLDIPDFKGQISLDDLRKTINNHIVPVAMTPYGNADSPLYDTLFVLPHVEDMTVGDLVDKFQSRGSKDPVYYMQSQDNNMKNFKELIDKYHKNLLTDVPWSKDTLEATNLWIGSSGTISRLHNDNYENFYHQLIGCKVIYLIPPSDVYYVHEKFLTSCQYQYDPNLKEFKLSIGQETFDHKDEQNIKKAAKLDNSPKILFPTMDPRNPDINCKVYKVLLKPGDVLFIPALWYHQVEIPFDSSENPENISVSMNYWIKPSQTNPLWSSWDFLRYSSLMVRGYDDEEYFGE